MARKNRHTDGFKLRRNDTVGAAGAEEDSEFLRNCFVDTGDITAIENMQDVRLIVLGRTGAGKSALFERLKETKADWAIEIQPENLALTHIANSNILNYFSNLGINLDPFFSLLWRHIFTVEILNRYFQQYIAPQRPNAWDWLMSFFTGGSREDREMQEAINYLREWGEEFFKETEYRVNEITQKIEVQLTEAIKTQLGGKFASLGVDMGQACKLTVEEKAAVVQRAQQVVSQAQVKDLHQVLKLLGRILTDRQKHYYIIVDRLDENWVEEKLRYRLIMALVQTAKEFIHVSNAKIIIALRRDLIDRVFRLTRDAGFQEEKISSLYMELKWTKGQILDVLDRRVNYFVRRRYTTQTVGYKDLLPKTFHGMQIGEYISELATRPRDVIAFFNTCIVAGADSPKLTVAQLSQAEGEYSRGRLRALADEWSADHPHLLDFAQILKGRPSTFKLDTVLRKDVEDLCLDIIAENPDGKGILHETARAVVDLLQNAEQFKTMMFQVFCRVGLVGFKMTSHERASSVEDPGTTVLRHQIDGNTSVTVAPCYVRGLGVKDRVHSKA